MAVLYIREIFYRLFKVVAIIALLILLTTSLPANLEATSRPASSLNPLHGIDAPIGFRWTDTDRATLAAFHNANGLNVAPGLVVALSVDMTAANNAPHIPMERDLHSYQQQGSQVLVRMWPQRFPGGVTDQPDPAHGTVSGTPQDAVGDVWRFLSEQETREGWHFTNIIPGNEMNIEWPNQRYDQNLLPWLSNDDPAKYQAINQFMLDFERDWQQQIATPEGRRFSDVNFYFPALAQDGAPNYFAGFNFYAGDKPSGNKYDLLRPAIEAFGHFSWHNYWRPGHAWEDRAIANFPNWLKKDLTSSNAAALPSFITESGWSPQALTIPNSSSWPNLGRGLPFQLWQIPGGKRDLFTYTQDDVIEGRRFEDDLQYFINVCSGAAYNQPNSAAGVAVWLAASNGGFPEAAGLWRNQAPSRWLSNYAAWNR